MDERTETAVVEGQESARARTPQFDPANFDLSRPAGRWPGSAPAFAVGNRANPGGKPKGASMRAAVLRELARDPDGDGVGKLAGELGRGVVDAAQALSKAVKGAELDPKAIGAVANALRDLVGLMDSLEPNTRKVETARTEQKLVLHVDAARAERTIPARVAPAGATEPALGPIHDAPLPSLQSPPPASPPPAHDTPHPLGP